MVLADTGRESEVTSGGPVDQKVSGRQLATLLDHLAVDVLPCQPAPPQVKPSEGVERLEYCLGAQYSIGVGGSLGRPDWAGN
jgi:hypothetical protein